VLATLITLYGIKNCDTVKKARVWLEERGIDYSFHDFREDGIDESRVREWLAELGWQELVNRRSTSWKSMDAGTREKMDADRALREILRQPTLIKRPLLDTGKQRFVGFSAEDYERIFSHHTL
jgi:Spx/MgsR family transcriptional regulator